MAVATQRPRQEFLRAATDFGPRKASPSRLSSDEDWELRHGWEEQYNSEEYLTILNSEFYMYYTDKRHESGGKPKLEDLTRQFEEWRNRDRVKTVFAGLMLCLNLGVDPPDVVKTNPTATLECWIDPAAPSSASTKVMESIGKALMTQYETLSIRTRYKQFLDPSHDETKRCCITLRRNSRDERVLFHYNGHGVPLPTSSGEIWYFNRNYTQYIPVSLYDLQQWLAGPTIYVLDVSHAGNVIANFGRFIEKHEQENKEILEKEPDAAVQSYSDNILLAACGKAETLPTNPDLPADLFTSCLTTPVAISLRCFVLNSQVPIDVTLKDLEKVPGRSQERRTPLGELNWIFTAITDTIAWGSLSRKDFRKLFRQDLMVAALFRNYLLAERLMKANNCHPETRPELPSTHNHPLWQSWDLAVEMVLAQLPAMIASEAGGPHYEYQHSSFFAEQLTAFEVYLSQGAPERKAPDQLPIVLQVLLSQVHRLRALILLSRFLDLGPWAVHLALSIGIFPYVLKLLQSAAHELKPVMIFIWARILAFDQSTQSELLKDNGYKYFLTALKPDAGLPVGNQSEHRAMSAFIIAMFCKDFHQGQVVSLSPELFQACLDHMYDPENPLLRQWSCLCISMLWKDFPEAKWAGIRANVHQRLCQMVLDPVPEVRAAALHALKNFLGIPDLTEQVAQTEQAIVSTVMIMTSDGNSMVRGELVVFFSYFVKRYENKFIVAAYEELVDERHRLQYLALQNDEKKSFASQSHANLLETAEYRSNVSEKGTQQTREQISKHSIHASIWKHILILSIDPHPEVARKAILVTDYMHAKLLSSALGTHAQTLMDDLIILGRRPALSRQPSLTPLPRLGEVPIVPNTSYDKKNDGYLAASLKRTATSFVALKNIAFGSSATGNSTSPMSSSSSTLNPHQPQPQPSAVRIRVPDEWSRPPDAHDHSLHSVPYEPAERPMPRDYRPDTESDTTTFPLKSGFYDWSIEYFREPQMKTDEPDEPGSDDYNSRLWRRMRNEKTLNTTQPLKALAGTSRWDVPSGSVTNKSQPIRMCFHQFEDHLAVADDRDGISVWDWQQRILLNRFSNGNPTGSKITETQFVNEDDQALLITGANDGVVKIFRDYDMKEKIELVAAYRGLTDLVPSNKNVGMVFEWQQGQGKLLVAGDVKVIRIWNAATEICTNEIPARSGSCITSLTSDQVAGNVFVAGYGDGALRVFDQREKPATAMKQAWRSHKQWITNVHMQRGGMRELISGSRNGEIKLWDIRMKEEIRTITATRNTLRTLSVHEHAPVFVTGSDKHDIKFFNVNGAFLNSVVPNSKVFPTLNRTNPIAATAFHPHRMMLACSSLHDDHISLFTCHDRRKSDRRSVVQDV
ncbi:hypothetical protein MMC27_000961 [Xylographa pallens]|nr:hypothetical protein [Xylographa pallens]